MLRAALRVAAGGHGAVRGAGRRGLAQLSQAQVNSYHKDGYLFVRSLFSTEEVDLLRETVLVEPAIATNAMNMKDNTGMTSKLLLWERPGDDTYGMFARGKRWTGAAADLIQAEPYHFHTKLMLKEPRVGGAWEWHQDFGYWYQIGCLNPDQMFSSILAIDRATEENGCLQVLRGSHKLGRIGHGATGEQAGADMDRVEQAMERLELVYCDMEPGDVLFTHSNLLHTSAPNLSDHWRRSMIVAYNAKENGPWENGNWVTYQPLDIVEDSAILEMGVKPNDATRADYLDESRNKDTFAVESN